MILVVLSTLPTTVTAATTTPEDASNDQEGHSQQQAQHRHSNNCLKQLDQLKYVEGVERREEVVM